MPFTVAEIAERIGGTVEGRRRSASLAAPTRLRTPEPLTGVCREPESVRSGCEIAGRLRVGA